MHGRIGSEETDEVVETAVLIKKGGDNQVGYHLPGWGGVLLGKLIKQKPIIALKTPLSTTGTKNNHQFWVRI